MYWRKYASLGLRKWSIAHSQWSTNFGLIFSHCRSYLKNKMEEHVLFIIRFDFSVANTPAPRYQGLKYVMYYRLSIYRGYIWYDSAHSRTITMMKLRSDLHSWQTPQTSPLRASYGVSVVSYPEKPRYIVSALYYPRIYAILSANFSNVAIGTHIKIFKLKT